MVHPKYHIEGDFPLIVVRIIDCESFEVKGHTAEICFIKYYKREKTKEQYLLSGDKNNYVFIWDIQKNYEKNYKIYFKVTKNYIHDAILLYNTLDEKNYLIVSNYDRGKNAKLYEFKNNNSLYEDIFTNGLTLIKDIFRNHSNLTNYMIIWLYKNEYYLIECCDAAIYINFIFKDECYMIFKGKNARYGILYKNDYLLVNSDEYIKMYDLVNKELNKEIKLDGYAYKFFPLDSINIIIASKKGLMFYNLEKDKLEKVINEKNSFTNFHFIKLSQIGESLIADENNSLVIYRF